MKKDLLKAIMALIAITLIPTTAVADETADTVAITNLGDCFALEDGTNVEITFNGAVIVLQRITSNGYKGFIADSTGGIEVSSGMISNLFKEIGYEEGTQLDGGALNGTITFTNGIPVLGTNKASGSTAKGLPTTTTVELNPTEYTVPTVKDSANLCTLVKIEDVKIASTEVSNSWNWFTITDVNGETLLVNDAVFEPTTTTSYNYITDGLEDDTWLDYITGVLTLNSAGEYVLIPTEYEVDTIPAVTSIAEAIALGSGAECKMYFNDAYITAMRYTSSTIYGFVEDETGAMTLTSSFIASIFKEYDMVEGTILNGGPLYGTIYVYNNTATFNISDKTGSMSTLPEVTEGEKTPTTITIEQSQDSTLACRLVKIENVTIAELESDDWNWFTLTDGSGNTMKANDAMLVQTSASNWQYLTDDFLQSDGTTYTETALASITGILYYSGSEFILYPTAYELPASDGTGIKSITTATTTNNGDIYTISGVKVNGTALSKGVYISNGQKFVIK